MLSGPYVVDELTKRRLPENDMGLNLWLVDGGSLSYYCARSSNTRGSGPAFFFLIVVERTRPTNWVG